MPVRVPRYYEYLGLGHDDLVRCKDCRRLIVYQAFKKRSACPTCGNKRVTEVTALTLWEWLRIRLGLLRFNHRAAFLKEFSARTTE